MKSTIPPTVAYYSNPTGESYYGTRSYKDNPAFLQRPNEITERTLTFLRMKTDSGSSTSALFQDKDGDVFNFWMTELGEMIPFIKCGEITGRFVFKKQGAIVRPALILEE